MTDPKTPEIVAWPPDRPLLALVLADDAPARVTVAQPGGRVPDEPAPLVEVGLLTEGREGNSAGAQHRFNAASSRLRVAEIDLGEAAILVVQRDEATGLEVRSTLRRPAPGAVRFWQEAVNRGGEPICLVYLSSLSVTGFAHANGSRLRDLRIHRADNAWFAEGRWRSLTPEAAGLVEIGDLHHDQGTSKGRYAVIGYGSWPTAGHLPLGAVTSRDGPAWAWQIEHSGAWVWELDDHFGDLMLLAGGPTDAEHQWRRELAPGASFEAASAVLVHGERGLEDALRTMTTYRRTIRRPHPDNERLPVVFNDYMNTLMGNPTEKRLRPLIRAAADVGSEYFVIDAGWYAEEGSWWGTVGAWEPSSRRFPSGLDQTLELIRSHDMVPGLWLEPEVVGVRSGVADDLPDEAFLRLGGRRIRENGRFHLDFRSTLVRDRLDRVVDRLVGELRVGYLKLDYNSHVLGADSELGGPGHGLLGHQRAFLGWLDDVSDRHPDLVLESCASGAMRCDYATLSRLPVQSTSDQRDPLLTASIAAAAPAAIAPEQAAVWAYPQPEMDDEMASFCLVNAMLGRIHLSGFVNRMDARQRGRVRAALDAYRSYRDLIRTGLPGWPLGLPGWYDEDLALSLASGGTTLVSVWFRGERAGASVALPPEAGWSGAEVDVVFPADLETSAEWDDEGRLAVSVPAAPAARVIRLRRG